MLGPGGLVVLTCEYQELGNLQKDIHETWVNLRSSSSLVVFWEALNSLCYVKETGTP